MESDDRSPLRQRRLEVITPGLNTFVCECAIFLRSYTQARYIVPLDIFLHVHFPGRGIFTEITSFMAAPGRKPTYYIRVGRYKCVGPGTTHPREHIHEDTISVSTHCLIHAPYSNSGLLRTTLEPDWHPRWARLRLPNTVLACPSSSTIPPPRTPHSVASSEPLTSPTASPLPPCPAMLASSASAREAGFESGSEL